jgi:DNA-binding MarR family transcriptional regulator
MAAMEGIRNVIMVTMGKTEDIQQQDLGGGADSRFDRYQIILKDLRILFRASQAHAKWVEKECGLSSAQLWMMWELFNSPGLTVSGLAKLLSIHASTCSNLLDKLQDKGLVGRNRSGKDQRVVHLLLTDKGVKLLAKAPRPAQGVLADVLQRLPDEILNYLEVGLMEFVKAVKGHKEEDSMFPIDS